jgi:hypothetical protein
MRVKPTAPAGAFLTLAILKNAFLLYCLPMIATLAETEAPMSAQPNSLVSVAEYLDAERRQHEKHEFFDGEIYWQHCMRKSISLQKSNRQKKPPRNTENHRATHHSDRFVCGAAGCMWQLAASSPARCRARERSDERGSACD